MRPRHNSFIHLLTMTLKWVRTVLLEKINNPHIPDYTLKDKMGDCATKQWRLTVQQSCKNIPCFSTCCKGEIIVQILSGNEEDLKPGILRSKQSGKLRWKRSSKSSESENNTRKVATWLSKQFTYTVHKPERYHFKTNRVFAESINYQ